MNAVMCLYIKMTLDKLIVIDKKKCKSQKSHVRGYELVWEKACLNP